jgi:peptidyl-prolyl cis-trans isomerase B (cyclophilin B)
MLRTAFVWLGSFVLAAAAAVAQEIPGLRATLVARSIYAAHTSVDLRLYLQVDADTEVPVALLTGARLIVKCNGADAKPVGEPGKPGNVPLAAGTRIERTLSFPAGAFLPDGADAVAQVSVALDGVAGTTCSFKVAPDGRKVDLATLDLDKTQVMLVTSHGDMLLSFRPDKAPKHVENFLSLCLKGFYDGTRFHRIAREFMIQGGCPNTRDDSKPETWGQGGPGYRINAEFNDLRHLRGTLSMARLMDPNSAGSGFFICHKEAPQLDGKYSAFGNLVEGADTLDRIATVPVGGAQRETPLVAPMLHAAIVLPVKK